MTPHHAPSPDTAKHIYGHLAPINRDSAQAASDSGSNSATHAPTAPPAGETTSPETSRHTASARRGTTAVTTRDTLDADLVNAVRRTARMRQAFYILVLLVALVGQVTGSVHTLGIPTLVAIPAVAALELGGVVVMANADVRRRLGERALASRILSAAIAAAAVTFNWVVHPDQLVGGFYSAMSALGYLVWLMHAGNQRRDRLRATGDLPPTPPAYEVFGHWIRHPVITLRARSIAKADGLDLYDSLKAARATIAREHRHQAIATVLHRKIRKAVDPATADIAVQVYDLDEIAARLTAAADYHGLTTLLAADLAPETIITARHADRGRRRWRHRGDSTAVPPTATPTPVSPSALPYCAPVTSGTAGPKQQPVPDLDRTPTPNDSASPPAASSSTTPTGMGRAGNGEGLMDVAGGHSGDDCGAKAPTSTAEAVAYWLRKEPDLAPEILAERIGKSLRSVYRYLPADYPRRPGIARERTRQRLAATRRAREPADGLAVQ